MIEPQTFWRFRPAHILSLTVVLLSLTALVEGAEAPQSKDPETEAVNPLQRGQKEASTTTEELSKAPAKRTPPRQFVPRGDDPEGQVKAVDFPKDI